CGQVVVDLNGENGGDDIPFPPCPCRLFPQQCSLLLRLPPAGAMEPQTSIRAGTAHYYILPFFGTNEQLTRATAVSQFGPTASCSVWQDAVRYTHSPRRGWAHSDHSAERAGGWRWGDYRAKHNRIDANGNTFIADSP